MADTSTSLSDTSDAAQRLTQALGYSRVPAQIVHARTLPARSPLTVPWPHSVPQDVRQAFAAQGIHEPFAHQGQAIEHIVAGTHTIIATGTASGKSLAYQAAVASGIASEAAHGSPGSAVRTSTALYVAPTKALGADQLLGWQRLASLGSPGLKAASYDGDTPGDQRRWVRDHANVVVTNPDMLHVGILGQHSRWALFFRNLRWIIIDEAHSYRGVFGSHMANVLRRVQRVCAHYENPGPVFIGASATATHPANSFGRLIGTNADNLPEQVTQDTSGHGAVTVGLWESEFSDSDRAEHDAPMRRSLIATGADLITDLAVNSIHTMAFIRSRRGAEAMAQAARRQLSEVDPALGHRVAAYRAGLLPEERREVEAQLSDGRLLAVATTPALELGVDISGLDAVIISGWPGTRASFFQQLGRAGRAGQDALVFFVAGNDPLDTYVAHHPEAIFDAAIEDAVIDPTNPHILGPHLCAAAAELPLTPEEFELFGEAEAVRSTVEDLTSGGYLRRRPAGWFWSHPEHAAAMISLRDAGGAPLNIVEAETGALLGDMSASQAHYQAHPGAVYVHQGRTWLVTDLDEEAGIVAVVRDNPPYYTQARDITEISIRNTTTVLSDPSVGFEWATGFVEVTTQVVSYQRRELLTGKSLGEEVLELPASQLFTQAVWFTAPSQQFVAAGVTKDNLPGALHAAEHAMIGMLALVASNDRWDIGGVSIAMHHDTGQPTVFIYDGQPGGAGFAERGFHQARTWIVATKDAILACTCPEGCPACVQSPKCGNRNDPLHKQGAATVLNWVLSALDNARPADPTSPNRH